MQKTALTLLLFVGFARLIAQPIPAPPQAEPIAIIGATIHTGDGRVIPDGVILLEDGRITALDSRDRNTAWQQDRYKQIFAEGKHLYPGLIALISQLGLVEIESVRPTRDHNETGDDNLNARALIAFNTDSRVIPTVRSNGVLQAQITPAGGRWAGLSSVVQLDAWNWEDAVIAADKGLHLNWPSPYSSSGWWAEPGETSRNKEYQEEIDKLERFVREARGFCDMAPTEEANLRFRALCPVLTKNRTLFIEANYAVAIMDAVLWAKSHGITPVITGGRDSWHILPFLKEQGISIVLRETQKLPGTMDEDIDQPFRTPAMLRAAGIPFAITVNGYWQQRNLSYHAGQAVPFGLSREAALEAITLGPARILGLDDHTGSLRVGKEATLIIADGDILDMRSSRVIQAYIQGRELDLDDHHKQLYRRFQAKYGESDN